MPSRPAGCAAVRATLAEPLHATAPERAASWLLVEHPGPWPSSELPADLPKEARLVLAAAEEAAIRPQLVRRVRDRQVRRPTVVVASCRPDARWAERRTLEDLRALEDLDLAALAAGRRPGFGDPHGDPVVLVCTHGRRDVCCARLGRPLAGLLDAELPGAVWETTHVGGDRFAPNVVTLPDGTYHGGLGLADVPALVRALAASEVLLPQLRGRAGLPTAVQAADHFLRAHLGLTAVGAVQPVACTPAPNGPTCVELLAADGRWCVHVAASEPGAERLTSCAGDGTTGTPASYELLTLRRMA